LQVPPSLETKTPVALKGTKPLEQRWLGCVVETGPALFLSCEEPEANVRDRLERICKHRHIDPHAIEHLLLHFPDLDATWLATADRLGKVTKTTLTQSPALMAGGTWPAAL
jgi:RecA-family ATPase